MTRSQDPCEFSYQGMAVGYFEEECIPTVPGKYQYMPYRGPGHYEMQSALKNGKRPCCTIGTISFEVMACPEYGILELTSFVFAEPSSGA